MAESPGFTGLGAPSLPGFPVSPLPGQCINSQLWLQALTHRVAPLMCGRPGHRRRRTVLLACRQWDSLGLARWLPCLGVGAWRSAPLLPWRVQCPVRVCAALAAGLGGSGRYLVLCLSRFPLPARRVPRCVWRALLSGFHLPSLAGTPFHAVCEFRELRPVALPRALCMCVRSRSRGVRSPLPWVVWRAHLARSRHWALVGPFDVVRAPPRVLPWSLALFGVLGGGRSGPGSSLPGLACTPCWGCVPRGCLGAVPGGGWPITVVRGVWCQVLSLPRPPVLWGGQPGYRDPCVPCAVCAGVGSQHRFQSVRPCGPALLAVGVAEGLPRGGCLRSLLGASEVGRSPSPNCSLTGRAVGVRHPHAVGAGVWAWGPITAPLACMPCGGCVPRGWQGALPGGGACHRCEGRLVSGAVPPPAARPLVRGAESRHPCVPGAVGAGVGTRHLPHSVCPCRLTLLAVGVAEGRPRAGGLPPLRGASEVRRSPLPDCPPTGRAVWVRHPRVVGTGVWVWGPNTVPLACTPCGGCVPRG